MPSNQLTKWAVEEGLSNAAWTTTRLGIHEGKGVTGKKSNLARTHIRAVAKQDGVTGQTGLGEQGWKLFLRKCVRSCEQLKHLKAQVDRWATDPHPSKDLLKVGVALEYFAQEALRAGRTSGILTSPEKKRRRTRQTAETDDSDEEDTPSPAAKKPRESPQPATAIRAVFVCPEQAARTEERSLFAFKWPRFDDSLVATITSIVSTTMENLAEAITTGMPHPGRDIRAIWGVLVEESTGSEVEAPDKHQVFLLDNDNAVHGWVLRTQKFLERTVYIVYRRIPQGDEPVGADTPIPGNRPFFSLNQVFVPEKDTYVDIGEDEDNELEAHKKEPKSLPWALKSLKTKELLVCKRIIRQQRLLSVLRARARAIHEDWEDTEVAEDDVPWLLTNRYITNPPAPGSEAR
jgi:hypothetical protein